MKTINVKNCNVKKPGELYAMIVKEPAVRYCLLIPRATETGLSDDHFINSMEFGCAAYAAHRLRQLSTDFSYMVPSPYRRDAFRFEIETIEPGKLAALLFVLCSVYNRNFTNEYRAQFHFEAAQYFGRACSNKNMVVAALGLVAVAREQLELSLKTEAIDSNDLPKFEQD